VSAQGPAPAGGRPHCRAKCPQSSGNCRGEMFQGTLRDDDVAAAKAAESVAALMAENVEADGDDDADAGNGTGGGVAAGQAGAGVGTVCGAGAADAAAAAGCVVAAAAAAAASRRSVLRPLRLGSAASTSTFEGPGDP